MGIFSRFKRNKAPLPTSAEPVGFFSTDLPIAPVDRELYKELALQRSIKVGAPSAATVNHGFDTSIQEVKQRFGRITQDVPTLLSAWFAAQGFIGWQTAAIIAQQWLVGKACFMPADDAVRHWFKIDASNLPQLGDANDLPQMIADEDERYKLKKNLIQFLGMGRVFGVRHCLFRVRSTDPDYYLKPFNPDGITPGSYLGMTQIDPYWMAPELDARAAGDPASPDFYEPTWWNINGKRYHKSHFVIFRNGELADILKPTYLYGGIPVPQKIMERVYAAERTANEAPQLALTKRLNIQKVDVDKAFANQEVFEEKARYQNELRNNYGTLFIGKEEEATQLETSLAELDAVIMSQFQLVAAAANVPSTKLLGTSPKGFDATGEFEARSYHEELETLQSNALSDVVTRHHLCVIRSNIAPQLGVAPFIVRHVWEPVDSPTAEEEANVRKTNSETDKNLFDTGAIDAMDIRTRLANDPNSGYSLAAVIDEAPTGEV
ncbi:MAG TPA: DUF1073 domain-containing protein [Pyrinomonadaceae bacterium]|nr:DUF1073 domain-containing protein [Pyrinomonadaceae bacterium]